MLKDAGSAWANVRVAAYMFSRIIYQYRSPFVIILISYHGCLILIYYYLLHYSTLIFISRIIQASFSWCFDEVTAGNPVDFILFHPISRQDGFLAKCLYQLSFYIKYLIISFYINFSTTWSESSGRMNWRSKLATRPNGVSGRSTTHSEPKKRDQITAIGVLDPEIVSGLKPIYVYNNSNNSDTNWIIMIIMIIMIIIMYYDHNIYIYIMIIIE